MSVSVSRCGSLETIRRVKEDCGADIVAKRRFMWVGYCIVSCFLPNASFLTEASLDNVQTLPAATCAAGRLYKRIPACAPARQKREPIRGRARVFFLCDASRVVCCLSHVRKSKFRVYSSVCK